MLEFHQLNRQTQSLVAESLLPARAVCRVADFNRRLRFSLTPKNFVTCLSFHRTHAQRHVFHKPRANAPNSAMLLLASGDEPNPVIDLGESLLGLSVCLGCAVGKQTIEFGDVAEELFGAVANWFDGRHNYIGDLAL